MRINETNMIRREKYKQSAHLLSMEQKYHFQAKLQLNDAVQMELVILKQGIVRERNKLHELETKQNEQEREQKRIIEDITRANAFDSDTSAETSLKMKRLQDQLEEANIQRQEMQEKLEWTQGMLNEQRDLR